MGFDNECIPNIQSLPGEYFCPVCRLLVYPNEALQSQCTHLYCKPCLAYVAGTTRACPYDGYLVTEADSKPLLESNKPLAETIGKINVHCLYHRSGCTWQGSLSDCTSHCSGCAFGNSAVVCNRCGVQIVHRQIQEHAQSCAGVQSQPLNADGSQVVGTMPTNDQGQVAGTMPTNVAGQATVTSTTSQSYPSKTPSTSTQETALQATSTPAVAQTSVPTTEQWYQQQQQYQQYYQQYPGYDPYQQHYQQYYQQYQQQPAQQYQQPLAQVQPPNSQAPVPPQLPVQPQAPIQPQQQIHGQAQAQAQSQPEIQLPVAAHPQNQATMNQQSQPTGQPQPQFQAQSHFPQPGHLHPQPYTQAPVQPQPLVQMPSHQQPPSLQQNAAFQSQPVAHSQLQHVPQTQSTSHPHHHQQLVQQAFASQPSQSGNPTLQAVTANNAHLQPHSQPMQLAVPQHAHMYPQDVPQQQSQHPVATQSQLLQPPMLRPLQNNGMPPNIQQTSISALPSQFSNPLSGQQNPLHAQAHQAGLPVHQRPTAQPVQQPIHQQYVQGQQLFSGKPLVQNHIHQQILYTLQQVPSQLQVRPQAVPQQFPQLSHGYPQPQPLQSNASPYAETAQHAQNIAGRHVLPPHGGPDKPFQQQSGPSARQISDRRSDSLGEKGIEIEASWQDTAKKDSGALSVPGAAASKTIKSESDLKPEGDENKSIANNIDPSVGSLKESVEGDGGRKDVPMVDNRQEESSVSFENKMLKASPSKAGASHENLPSKSHNGNLVSQSSAFSHFRPTGPTNSLGHPAQLRPLGPGHPAHIGQPLNAISENVQRPGYNESHGPEYSSGGFRGPESALMFSSGMSYHGPPQGSYTRSVGAPSEGERMASYGSEAGMFPPHRPNLGIHSNVSAKNGVPRSGFDPSSSFGLRNERFGPNVDEHMHPFSHGPARHMEEDFKLFSRDAGPALQFGGPFSSRIVDRGLHGFRGEIGPRPLENGPYRPSYDSGLQMDTLGSHAPSRHFPPFNHGNMLHHGDGVEGPIGFRGEPFGRPDPTRTHQGFLGPGAGYAQRHVDGLGPKGLGRDHLSSRAFAPLPGLHDFDGMENRRGPGGRLLHDNMFPGLPSHSRRDAFDGPGSLRASDHYRFSEYVGRDGMPNHLRAENFVTHKLSGEVGLGTITGHHSMREFPVPEYPHHARFGEPGFRSSFTNKRSFPGAEENYTGEPDSKKRKPPSMGWCRICKVDCETVEGLELHSQTQEHQKMALDMVATIKQNAKKQKLLPNNSLLLDDASKSRTFLSEGRGEKL